MRAVQPENIRDARFHQRANHKLPAGNLRHVPYLDFRRTPSIGPLGARLKLIDLGGQNKIAFA
jgi:hypothetical protein